MNRETAKKLLPVITAFAEGKTVELLSNEEWCAQEDLGFQSLPENYRVKPEPKLVPWTFETRPKEVVWVYKKGSISDRMIVAWKDDAVEIVYHGHGSFNVMIVSYNGLLKNWLQRDGSPCGHYEEAALNSPA